MLIWVIIVTRSCCLRSTIDLSLQGHGVVRFSTNIQRLLDLRRLNVTYIICALALLFLLVSWAEELLLFSRPIAESLAFFRMKLFNVKQLESFAAQGAEVAGERLRDIDCQLLEELTGTISHSIRLFRLDG